MSECRYKGSLYSEGSLICVNGRELKCSSGEWHETGYTCGSQKPAPEDIPVIPEGSPSGVDSNEAQKTPRTSALYTAYADPNTMRQDQFYLYFKGSETAGHTCSLSPSMRPYQIPRDDVVSRSPRMRCVTGRDYVEVKFNWPI